VRKHISPGAVLGVIAVMLAMAGSAVAASKITGAQIKDGTVTGKDIKNDSLTLSDLSAGAVNNLAGETGPAGPAGPQGPAGPPGPTVPGSPQTSKLTRVQVTYTSPGNSFSGGAATCPNGSRVVSGGFFHDVADAGEVFANAGAADGTSWIIGAYNYGTTSGTLTVFAYCSQAGVAVASSVQSRHAAAMREVANLAKVKRPRQAR
jgi:hypothetical protein